MYFSPNIVVDARIHRFLLQYTVNIARVNSSMWDFIVTYILQYFYLDLPACYASLQIEAFAWGPLFMTLL